MESRKGEEAAWGSSIYTFMWSTHKNKLLILPPWPRVLKGMLRSKNRNKGQMAEERRLGGF